MDQHEYDGPRVGDVVRTADGTAGRIVGASGVWSPGVAIPDGQDVYVSTADDLVCVPVSDVAGFPAIDETDSDHPDNYRVTFLGPDPDRGSIENGGCNACRRPFDGSGAAAAVLVVRDHWIRFCTVCTDRLRDAVASYDGRPAAPDPDPAIETARDMGTEAGRAAGSWAIDGNTTAETARAILDGIADGDPEVLDRFGPPSPLSGEWAGDPTPRDVFDAVGLDPDDADRDDVLAAYEQGFSDGYWETVEADAVGIVATDDDGRAV